MSLKVLINDEELQRSSRSLRAAGASRWPWDGDLLQIGRLLMSDKRPPPRHDRRKDWDVDRSRRVIERDYSRDAVILDVGAYNSAILWTLVRRGFRNLHGLDLTERLRCAPRRQLIRYVVGDLYAAPFRSERFDVITALSTIEHGLDLTQLFPAIRRLARAGGLVVVSTDYWPEKISTDGLRIFGRPWTIFSRGELEAMLRQAETFGLHLDGAADWTTGDRVIHWQGRHYTFVHIVWRVGEQGQARTYGSSSPPDYSGQT